jgi:hypothetical protein
MPFVERDTVSVFYELEGDGSPLFLLVGAGGDGSAWRKAGYTAQLANTITLQIQLFAHATEFVHLTRPLRPPSTQTSYMRSIIACAKAEVEISCAPTISRARS